MVLGFLFGRKEEDKVRFHFTGDKKKQAKKSKTESKTKSKTKPKSKSKAKSKFQIEPKVKAIKEKVLKNKKKSPEASAKVVKKDKKVRLSKPGRTSKPSSKVKSRVVKVRPVVKKIQPKEILIGKITHFFAKPLAGVIKLSKGKISLGEKIHIKGRHTDFIQDVLSLQINNRPVSKAGKGEEVGIGVKERVRRKDKVYILK